MMNSDFDFTNIAKNIDKHILSHKLVDFYNIDDTCKILGLCELNIDQVISVLNDAQKKYPAKHILRIFQAIKMDSNENIQKIKELFVVIRKSLNSQIFKYLLTAFEHLEKVVELQKLDISSLHTLLADKQNENDELREQIRNAVIENSNMVESLSKYMEISKAVPVVPKKLENIPAQPNLNDKYVLKLKECKCVEADFEKIYQILREASNQDNLDAIQFSVLNGLCEVKDGEYNRTIFLTAASNGDVNLVKLLAENGCEIKTVDKYNRNALHLATIKGHIQIVAYLVNLRDININSLDNKFETSLHWAALYGNIKIVQILCQNQDIDINALDKDDETPLHKACYAGQLIVVQFLSSLPGIKLNPENKSGKTPLQVVTNGQKQEVKAYLKSKGCK